MAANNLLRCLFVLALFGLWMVVTIVPVLSQWTGENSMESLAVFLAVIVYPAAKLFPGLRQSGEWVFQDDE